MVSVDKKSSNRLAWEAEFAAAKAVGMPDLLKTRTPGPLGHLNGRLIDYDIDTDAQVVHGNSFLLTREVGSKKLSQTIARAAVDNMVRLGRYDVLNHPEFRAELESLADQKGGKEAVIEMHFAGISGFAQLMHKRIMGHPESLAVQKKPDLVAKARVVFQVFDFFHHIDELEKICLEEIDSKDVPPNSLRAEWNEIWSEPTIDMSRLVQIPLDLRLQFAQEDGKIKQIYRNRVDTKVAKIMQSSTLNEFDGIFRTPPRQEGRFSRSSLQHLKMVMMAVPSLHPSTADHMLRISGHESNGRTSNRGEEMYLPNYQAMVQQDSRKDKFTIRS